MPRIRTIKPQFWLDEHLGNICRDARLLYIGLWNLADDTGVFEYRPARIKIQIFPYDTDISSENIQNWLQQLENTKDIIKFSSNGSDFGYIPTFVKHQQIERPSKWKFTEIPLELRQNHASIDDSENTHQALSESSPTTPQPLSLGKRKRNREKEKEIDNIYNTWNKQELRIHRKLTNEIRKGIEKALTEYTEPQVIQAIENYTRIVKGDEYYFKYIWTLKDFLKRGLEKFLDWDIATQNYIRGNGNGRNRRDNSEGTAGTSQQGNNKFTKGTYGHLVES